MLRKLTVLLALFVVALCTVQAAVAGPKGNQGHSPNGNAWGGSGLVDGR